MCDLGECEGACVIWEGVRCACVTVGGSEGVHVSVHFLFITVEGVDMGECEGAWWYEGCNGRV